MLSRSLFDFHTTIGSGTEDLIVCGATVPFLDDLSPDSRLLLAYLSFGASVAFLFSPSSLPPMNVRPS